LKGECKRVLFASLFNSTLNPFGLHPSICYLQHWLNYISCVYSKIICKNNRTNNLKFGQQL